jgi:secondary thiamine-phosphate synthase enzyme
MLKTLNIKSKSKIDFIDITSELNNLIEESKIKSGLCFIYVPHTTAAITINEGADPSVKKDIIIALNKLIPFEWDYQHLEGNSAAHIKSSILGVSQSAIIEDGRLLLGTWQSVYFCEFDGPRHRKVYIKFIEKV